MEISKAAAAAVVAGSLVAGAGGTYLVTRGAELPVVARHEGPQAVVEPHPTHADLLTADPIGPLVIERGPAPAPRAVPPPVPRPAPAVAPVPKAPAPRPVAPAAAPVAPASAPPPPAASPVLPVDDIVFEPPAAEPVLAAAPPIELPVADAPPEPGDLVAAEPEYTELVVAADSVIGLQVTTSVSSETAEVEDRVTARVTRDVRVGERVAIPAGTRVDGEVVLVERGGRVRERARLGVQFTLLVLPDGAHLRIDTDTIYRLGESPGGETAAKIGAGAVGGAIIGGILGGAKGAAIGGSAGAGAGTAAVLAGGRNPATLPAGTDITVRVNEPIVVVVER